ncbi:hypothetical protein [Clostridium sp. JN-9]|uniref:hypothetical protein n=1 Tax=Clostridium sp. JN-9 TaxID=2507159 RepID=UPI000FFE0889|nr:hypothetical protein [Clostridium sp. JN-9]QAT39666.1 hypothetical protein EQM05_05035 [Clostridium sp. JN-9]
MSEDKEKKVLEKTRRNYSEIHTISGNLFKVDRHEGKKIADERNVKNPLVAVLIVLAAIGATWLVAFLILSLSKMLSH